MQRILLAFACLLVAATVVSATSTPRSQAKITSLPNINFTPSFDQYSGYITINNSTNKNLFYWFVTSTSGNPTNDPVILWLQGGPGCSGLGGGLMEENGPYYPYILNANNQSVGLTSAFYTWNKVANMIYIESPCGVGFSYSDNPADYHTNDNTTAMDNFLFLTYFFQMYPEWANNEFWITGESYGGVYIPTLAYVIMTNNSNPTLQNNLKKGGLMLGNPVTGCDGTNFDGEADILDLDTTVNNFYWHAMVSRRNYDTWNSLQCNTSKPPSLIKCLQLYATITKGVGRMDQPLRSQAATLRRRPAAPAGVSQMVQPLVSSAPVEAKANDDGVINPDCLYYSFCEGNATLQFNTAVLPDCFNIDDQVSAYLNDPAVQSAIHARPTKWEMCGGVIYNRNVKSLIPYLEALFQLAPTMRILYYSGDIDIATVPFPGTQRCLETMQRPILKEWRPWIVNKEIAGYVEVYDTYTYATIKGAGHEAPAYQPAGAYLLFTSFLKNQTLPAPPA